MRKLGLLNEQNFNSIANGLYPTYEESSQLLIFNIQEKFRQSLFLSWFGHTRLGQILINEDIPDAYTFFSVLNESWWTRLWFNLWIYLLDDISLSDPINRLHAAFLRLQEAELLNSQIFNQVASGKYLPYDDLVFVLSELKNKNIPSLDLNNAGENLASLIVFYFLLEANILTDENQNLVKQFSQVEDLEKVITLLFKAEMLSQKNFDLVIKVENVSLLLAPLNYLLKANILPNSNFDLAKITSDVNFWYDVIIEMNFRDVLNQNHFEVVLNSSDPMKLVFELSRPISTPGNSLFNSSPKANSILNHEVARSLGR